MPSNVGKRYYDNYVSMDDEDNLAPEKLAELKSCFGSFDRNGDGTISANEFQNALIRMNIYIPAEVLNLVHNHKFRALGCDSDSCEQVDQSSVV